MKKFYCFLLLIVIKTILTENETCPNTTASKESCQKYTNISENETKGDSCCYVEYKDENNIEKKFCEILKKSEVKNIVKILKKYKVKSYSIVCFSNWLKFSFNFLFLILCF